MADGVINIGPALSTSRDWERERRRRQAELLMGGGTPRTGHLSDGLADAGKQLVGSYQLKKEDERQKELAAKNNEALSMMLKGGGAKPWVNPDTGQTSNASAGGYEGMMASLANYGDTDVAKTLLPQLLMGDLNRKQSMADRDEARAYAESQQPRYETVQNPYGRGGVGQRDQYGKIVSYQGPDKPERDPLVQVFDPAMGGMKYVPQSQAVGMQASAPKQDELPKAPPGYYLVQDPQNPGQPMMIPVKGSPAEAAAKEPPKFTEMQSKAAGFGNRMNLATQEMTRVQAGPDGVVGTEDDFNPAGTFEHAKAGVPFIGNHLASPEFQQMRQGQENWVTANLRLESGAVIGPEEMQQEIRKYFPQPGDGPEVVAQKQRARAAAEQNLMQQSQGAYDYMFGAPRSDAGVVNRLPEPPQMREANMPGDAANQAVIDDAKTRLFNKYKLD